MAIKKVTPDPQPYIVKISHNGDDVFMDSVLAAIRKDWGVTEGYLIRNKMLPRQTAIIYDKYDQILVKIINGKIQYKRTTKEERDVAILQNTGGVSCPVFNEKN